MFIVENLQIIMGFLHREIEVEHFPVINDYAYGFIGDISHHLIGEKR